MTGHDLFYYSHASFTNAQLPLLKVAALWFDKLVLLDPAGASWDAVGAGHFARDAVWQRMNAGISAIVTPATVSVLASSGSAAITRRESVGAAVERT